MEVHGVSACRCGCGTLELDYVLHMTAGLAWQCFQRGALDQLHEVSVVHNGALIKVPLSRPRRSSRAKRRTERGVRENQRLAHAARDAARKRLQQIEVELYDVLYNDERRKRGLPIVPKRAPAGSFADVVKLKTQRLVYDPANAAPAHPPRQPL